MSQNTRLPTLTIGDFSHFLYAIKEIRTGLTANQNILINGHSGSGKSTMVRLLLNEKERDILEINSSNFESLSQIKNKCKCFATTKTIEFFSNPKQKLIFIDDLDVLISLDKNFMSFIIDFIKSNLCKIVCVNNQTVNKKNLDTKIEFTVNVTLKKLTFKQCFQIVVSNIPEQLDIDYSKLTQLIKENCNDLRTVLNHLGEIAKSIVRENMNLNRRPKFLEMNLEEIVYEMRANILQDHEINDILTHDINQIVCLIHENATLWFQKFKISPNAQLEFMIKFNKIVVDSEYIGKFIYEKYDFSIWDHYTFSKIKYLNRLLFDHFGSLINNSPFSTTLCHSQLINKQSLALNFNKNLIRMEKILSSQKNDCSMLFLYIYFLIHSKLDNKDIVSVLTKNEMEIITRYISDFNPSYKAKLLKMKATILK